MIYQSIKSSYKELYYIKKKPLLKKIYSREYLEKILEESI